MRLSKQKFENLTDDIWKRFALWIRLTLSYLYSIRCVKKSKFLDSLETTNELIVKRKSIIRFGDGEFNLLEGRDVHYQKYSAELKKSLELIVSEYISNPDDVGYILCMPGIYFQCNGIHLLKKRSYISSWSFSRAYFKKHYDRKISYGDAFLFSEINEKTYSQLWKNSNFTSVIFVHNNIIYAKRFQEKYGIETESILIPSENAFYYKDQILNEIKEAAFQREHPLVLISAGPAAKVIVYELLKHNIIAVDTGHCWDNPLNLRE